MAATLTLEIRPRSVAYLAPDPKNARTHSQKQLAQIAASISSFGFVNPILIDESGRIIAGHGRLAAAKLLGMPDVPTIELRHLTPKQKRNLMLADNRIALNAGWDEQLLSEALTEILAEDIDFDLGSIGFETAEVDLLLAPARRPDPADEVPEPDPQKAPTSQLGDLWLLAEHRLLCGDALQLDSYLRLLGDEVAQFVITDPPYNVPIDGHVTGLGAVKHDEFAMASGEMSAEEFATFLHMVFAQIAAHSTPGAIVVSFMDWRHISELVTAGTRSIGKMLNLCIWNKTNGGMGSLYRSKHELVGVFQNGAGPHINNVQLGSTGRYRTNVWDYAGANTFRAGRSEDLKDHPTVKPVAMIADAIMDCSRRRGIVLDPFGGSGTTLMAAERTGRQARLIELDPRYVDVAIARWIRDRKPEPVLAETGERYSAVQQRRMRGLDASADQEVNVDE